MDSFGEFARFAFELGQVRYTDTNPKTYPMRQRCEGAKLEIPPFSATRFLCTPPGPEGDPLAAVSPALCSARLHCLARSGASVCAQGPMSSSVERICSMHLPATRVGHRRSQHYNGHHRLVGPQASAVMSFDRSRKSRPATENNSEYVFHCWILDKAFPTHCALSCGIVAGVAHFAWAVFSQPSDAVMDKATPMAARAVHAAMGFMFAVLALVVAVWFALSHLPGRSPERVNLAARLTLFSAAVALPLMRFLRVCVLPIEDLRMQLQTIAEAPIGWMIMSGMITGAVFRFQFNASTQAWPCVALGSAVTACAWLISHSRLEADRPGSGVTALPTAAIAICVPMGFFIYGRAEQELIRPWWRRAVQQQPVQQQQSVHDREERRWQMLPTPPPSPPNSTLPPGPLSGPLPPVVDDQLVGPSACGVGDATEEQHPELQASSVSLADETSFTRARSFSRSNTISVSFGRSNTRRSIGEEQRTSFHQQCDEIKIVVNRYFRNRRWVVHESTQRWLVPWDWARMFAVLFLSVVSPVEITVRKDYELNWLTIAGFVWNAMFAADMLITFNRAYAVSRDTDSRLIFNRRNIAHRYLRGWFFVDLVSTIPYDMPLVYMATSGRNVEEDFQYTIRIISFLKVIRAVKLIIVVRAAVSFLTHRLRFTFASAEIFRLLAFMAFMVHYLACLWMYTGLHTQPSETTWLVNETTWIDNEGLRIYEQTGYVHHLYGVAVFVSIVAVFGGVSSVSPMNSYEYAILSSMMLVGGLMWAYVLSSLCSIFSALNPHDKAYKNQMDELTYFMEAQRLPQSLRRRLRNFFRQTQDCARAEGFDEIFLRMSDQLRSETAQLVAQDSLLKIWYFNHANPRWQVEADYLGMVALYLRPGVFEMNERIQMDKLTVIVRGQVWQNVRMFASGGVLGIDSIIDAKHDALRELAPAHCLSFVQVKKMRADA